MKNLSGAVISVSNIIVVASTGQYLQRCAGFPKLLKDCEVFEYSKTELRVFVATATEKRPITTPTAVFIKDSGG